MDISEWISYSSEDLEVAGILRESGKYKLSALHSNQSAEKMLKACYYSLRENQAARNEYTHDLVALVRNIRNNRKNFPDVMNPAYHLNRYYVDVKYPDNGDQEVDYEKSVELLDYAWEIYNLCMEWLERQGYRY